MILLAVLLTASPFVVALVAVAVFVRPPRGSRPPSKPPRKPWGSQPLNPAAPYRNR